jgi:hypothetical protein
MAIDWDADRTELDHFNREYAAELAAEQNQHITAVKSDPNDFLNEGLYKASCTCGRFSSDGHESKTMAQGAADRHIASQSV